MSNHKRIVTWAVALWIYSCILLTFLFDDTPTGLIVVGAFIPFVALYLYLVKREVVRIGKGATTQANLTPFMKWYVTRVTKNSKPATSKSAKTLTANDLNGPMRVRDVVEAFIAIVLACVLGLATVAFFFDPQLKRELGAPFTSCARDESLIITMPVNKTMEYKDATVAVHTVTYNVPQSSTHPTAYSYECEKATLVEVTIKRKDVADDKRVSLTDFSLENKDQEAYDWSPHPDSTEQYDYYAKQKGIRFIDRDLRDDTDDAHGWLVFSIREDNSNQETTLTYGEYGDESRPTIVLPR